MPGGTITLTSLAPWPNQNAAIQYGTHATPATKRLVITSATGSPCRITWSGVQPKPAYLLQCQNAGGAFFKDLIFDGGCVHELVGQNAGNGTVNVTFDNVEARNATLNGISVEDVYRNAGQLDVYMSGRVQNNGSVGAHVQALGADVAVTIQGMGGFLNGLSAVEVQQSGRGYFLAAISNCDFSYNGEDGIDIDEDDVLGGNGYLRASLVNVDCYGIGEDSFGVEEQGEGSVYVDM